MANDSYNHHVIEPKWIQRWEREGTYHVDLAASQRPYYNLMMFPYPSASGLHVGNMYAFVGSDVHGRFMRAQQHDVFEPMGFDAFGIHSENYALKRGIHPGELVPQSIAHFRDSQLKRIGAMFDWSHQVDTTDPRYYHWTQWIFVKLFKAGLAYRGTAPVNWCPSCKTVLADEQAASGACERCGSHVERRDMAQWFFRITAYAQRLLDNLAAMDWSPATKAAQRHWIGRSVQADGTVSYRLHDWCVSRQRYWGPPIPIVYCDTCGIVPVPEEQLPVLLPQIADFAPDGSGRSPLARCEAFVNTSCPKCGGAARRETDVSDNFLDSAWYFLRYPSSQRDDVPFDAAMTAKWLPVDMYIGGNEHAVLHLMYTRFITMALHDMGVIGFEEPFKRFRSHGLIVKDGAKMSKSRPNTVTPDSYLRQYGADTFRCYLMFMGPYQEGGDFRDTGIIGVRRFLERLWRYATQTELAAGPVTDHEVVAMLDRTIRKVTEDIAALRYNTAIASLMELLNGISVRSRHFRACVVTVLQLLCPLAPFICHELWERLGEPGMPDQAAWPQPSGKEGTAQTIEYVVQVNGKLRDRVSVAMDVGQEQIEQAVRTHPRFAEWTGGRAVQRWVIVPGRLVNIVVSAR